MSNENTMAPVSNGSEVESIRNARTVAPRVDVFENEKELVVYADLPGVAQDGVDLRYEDGELVLQGKVKNDRTGRPLAREFEPVDYYRVFRVHESIDASKIDAELKNGVLTVHLPKEEKRQPRQVAVKSQA